MRKFFHKRRLTIFFNDICMVMLAWIFAFSLYFNFRPPGSLLLFFIYYVVSFQAVIFYFCGLYRGIWRFASIPDLMRIIKAVALGVLSVMVIFIYTNYLIALFPIAVIYGSLLLLFLSGPRIFYRWIKDYKQSFVSDQRVLIIGAGDAGERVARELTRLRTHGYQPIAFVDDNIRKIGQDIHGIRVVASCQDIPHVVKKLRINLNLIAIPSATPQQIERLVTLSEQAKVEFRTLPSLREIADGKVNIRVLPDVSLEKLLGRQEINLREEQINHFISNKVIAVSGGGGSIGSELCLQLAVMKPAKLIIIDNSEFNLYSIDLKLRNLFSHVPIKCYLVSVIDAQAINRIFAEHMPQLVFHAAAYKHVPLLEEQVRIAIHNNIIGTKVVAEAAQKNHCHLFVLISSDKAVNPTNIMGATKRGSEVICSSLNDVSDTNFITVRFGNVLNSAGSVVPLFRNQLKEGGPITVTHPDITRFFMTIAEASQLIIQAATIGVGGEIFVLDMGEPIKIRYLAEKLIQLSGKILDKDIHIQYTGLRPGEKLHEELFYLEEELIPTNHPKIKKANSQKRDWILLVRLLDEIQQAYDACDEEKLFNLLKIIVPEYQKEVQSPRAVNYP